jgi:predicted ABC-type ATPase
MKLDISPKEFQALSTTKKKKYIARLLIKESKAQPVAAESRPIAFVMAGLPGAGKTEFLDTLTEMINHLERWMPFVRIDLDQIVTVYPDYSPKDYYKFRSDGNRVLAWSVDEARHGRYNMMIDGTFSGKSGASVDTIGNLLDSGYIVQLVYLYDSAETAWNYTLKREKETARG